MHTWFESRNLAAESPLNRSQTSLMTVPYANAHSFSFWKKSSGSRMELVLRLSKLSLTPAWNQFPEINYYLVLSVKLISRKKLFQSRAINQLLCYTYQESFSDLGTNWCVAMNQKFFYMLVSTKNRMSQHLMHVPLQMSGIVNEIVAHHGFGGRS